ncbi:MAG TPA: LytTR family DNA-binding domain-containing protein [Vicinamibacterales bacterium]|nr:LytTR family DNA-binding domain-containing protein [Vicinamibacterales bacterium]
MSHELRAVVADDEQPAREELCFLLGQIEDVTVVGQADNGVSALEVISAVEPNVAFLDIQMPGLTGFEVANLLLQNASPSPWVVFVTAYDQYAIEAFEVNAVDYLLKPVEQRRLDQAVERLRRRFSTGQARDERIDHLVRLMADRGRRRDQLAIKVGDRFLLVQADDVIHASVDGDTIEVATAQVAGTSNYRTLDELQARLDPDLFWRVHRSHLVNINKIKEIVPWFSRNYMLRMKDAKGTEIPVSRAQTKRLRDYLKL